MNKCPIPGHENDRIIFFTRRHLASMVKTFILILMMIVVPILIIFIMLKFNPEFFTGIFLNFLTIFGAVYYMVVATFAFAQWVSYYYDIFIITDKEIIDISQSGIFDRRITEVSLLRIQDVSARIKGLWSTIFNYGDLIAESAGENTRTYVVDGIANPVAVADKILDLHNEHVDREERASEIGLTEGELRPVKIEGEKLSQYCPPTEKDSNPVNELKQPEQIEISKDDLNQGGEIKF